MYEYLNAAPMMESRRAAELNRRLEIRRVALERIAEQRTEVQRPRFTVRIAAGIRHLLPHTAARRTRAAHQA